MFDFNLASDEITTSPLTVRSLLTVASPLNITLKASDLASPPVPFPITKAGADVENELALVADEPEELNCPITKEAKSLAIVKFPIAVELCPDAMAIDPIAVEDSPLACDKPPIAVELYPLAVVPFPIAVEPVPLAVVLSPIATALLPVAPRVELDELE